MALDTSAQSFYLKEEVYFEPLINQWYAWPYLLPPVTRAMNMAGRQIRLMKSFVQEHQLHILANQDPSLAGGDFVACTSAQLDQVRDLVHAMESKYAIYFEIRGAIAQLNTLLAQQQGMSLEPLYAQIPAILDGYVELYYDTNHHAGFRLLESLLYASPLNQVSAETLALGVLSEDAGRPFVLSSPRLPDERHLHIDARFADPLVDTLFAMRTRPQPLRDIHALFGALSCRGALDYQQLFTERPPCYVHRPVSGQVRMRFIGHAGLLFETADSCVLIDPVLPSRTADMGDRLISFAELPEQIDYICITHTHMDHLCLETLLQLRHKTRQILVPRSGSGGVVDPSIKMMLSTLGFNVRECDDMENIGLTDGRITAIPFLGEHADLNIRSKAAWLVELRGKKCLCMADSACLSVALYHHIHRLIGDMDVLLVGMECVGAPMTWLYGALFTKPVPTAINESRRFNGADFNAARQLVDLFHPKEVYVYALGMESWSKYFMGIHYEDDAPQLQQSSQLVQYCKQQGITADRLMSSRSWNW